MVGCLVTLGTHWVSAAFAHHGVASLGVAGLEGPGAPIETSSSATLPKGKGLAYLKLDYAEFERKHPREGDHGDYNAFWIYGLGYGFTPWLSGYLFVPYYKKTVEDGSSDASGLADISLTGVFGFKYDEGLRLIPESQSLDDLEDWHFTIYGGLTLPTGDANVRTRSNEIDAGQSLGFGRPSYQLGFTGTKQFAGRDTFIFDTSYIYFDEYKYNDRSRTQFGSEFRVNLALTHRLFTAAEPRLRMDLVMEGNYLHLERDQTNGVKEPATGGHILYLQPGLRAYWRNFSVGLGIKFPSWLSLNEEDEQQGAEGTEDYRLTFTMSALF
jgi:hypothetical protein